MLLTNGVGIRPELTSQAPANAVEPLAEDPPVAVATASASPDDDEVAHRVGGDGGEILVVEGEGIHLELGSQGHATLVVPLAEGPPEVAVLGNARPDDDEVAALARCDQMASKVARALISGRVGIDLELRPDRLSAGGSGRHEQRHAAQRAKQRTKRSHGTSRRPW